MNRIRLRRRSLSDLLQIDSYSDFNHYLMDHAIQRYQDVCHRQSQSSLGSILAVCANYREAFAFKKFPFEQILITGLSNPDERLAGAIEADLRISYQRQNCESISLDSRSFDLVFCKEGLHHLARPVLGFYEMLRLSRKAVIFIEPYDTALGRMFEILDLSTKYEPNQGFNIHSRVNFVYRWDKRHLQSILNSYYLESGYYVEITLGWMSARLFTNPHRLIRRSAAIAGWMLSFLPGSRGNYMTSLIMLGNNIPADPVPVQRL